MDLIDTETSDLAARFPVIGRHTWLNHAAISPWPAVVIEAMQAFVDDNRTQGPLAYPEWIKIEARLRQRAAALLGGARPEDISVLANTSTGLNLVARGLGWQAGDSVVFPANDFPSNRLPWQALAAIGVEARAVNLDPLDPEGSLVAAFGPQTRLLAISSVQYDTGLRFDLERLGEACARQDVLFCLDAIQHLGALPLDPVAVGADFVVAGSHKWLMAPEGLALFWSSEKARGQLKVSTPGWRMYADPFDFGRDDWTPVDDGRRFEPGTLNMAGICGLDAAIGLLLEQGPAKAGAALLDRAEMLAQSLSGLKRVNLCSPSQRNRMAGIVSFRAQDLDAAELVAKLGQNDIHAAVRGPMVRLSPHFYTPFEQIEHAVQVIEGLVGD